jgi:putative membrane protein
MNPFVIVATTLFVVAGFIHVFIFYLESISWQKPSTWKRFGLKSQADADVVRPMAYNQGWYNLFLAIGAIGGSVATWVAPALGSVSGLAIATFAAASMVAAALVLVISNPRLARAAAMQGLIPLVGVIFSVIAFGALAV